MTMNIVDLDSTKVLAPDFENVTAWVSIAVVDAWIPYGPLINQLMIEPCTKVRLLELKMRLCML